MTTESRSGSRDAATLDACACSPRTIRVLEDPDRRAIVSALVDRDAPAPVDDLSARVAVSDADEADVAISLRHTHLPKLRNAGLVTDAHRHAVELSQHPDVRDGPLTADLLASVGQEVWTALDALHRDPVRPAALAQLHPAGSALTVGELARRLDAPKAAGDGSDGTELALRRVHAPRLDAVGLVRYDAGTDEVAYGADRWFPLSGLVEVLRSAGRLADGGELLATGDG
jgi:DNA-binding transcriptional ArsR family regulator